MTKSDAELPNDGRLKLDQMFRSDPFAASLDAEVITWGPGFATVSAFITERQTNFLGGGHGGILFSLGDIAMSFAANGYGRKALAVQIDIGYHRGVSQGEEVIATASETSRTRRFANYRLELHVAEKLVGSATGITFRTDDWHCGENLWPEEWRSRH